MSVGEWVAKKDFQVTSPITGVPYTWNKGHKFVLLDTDSNGNVTIKDKTGDKTIITTSDNFHEFMDPAF